MRSIFTSTQSLRILQKPLSKPAFERQVLARDQGIGHKMSDGGWQQVGMPTEPGAIQTCQASGGRLTNACDYSFADLYRAACKTTSMEAEEDEVKAACEMLYRSRVFELIFI